MSQPEPSPARLVPALDVFGAEPFFEATGPRPWLAIEPADPGLWRAGWIKLAYRLSLYDRPARPIISFRRETSEIGFRLGSGPILGAGEALVAVPAGTTAIWISPVATPGPFSFALERIETVPLRRILELGQAGDRSRFLGALATFAIGWRPEAELNFLWASQHKPLAAWPGERARLAAPANLKSFERPRSDWSAAPKIRLYACAGGAAPAQLATTLEALQAQFFPHWTLTAPGAPANMASEPRLVAADRATFDGSEADLIGLLRPGDRLVPHALACFIEAFDRAPQAVAAYCDEDFGAEPHFKPDWSPDLEAAHPYVGRLLLVRQSHARARLANDAVEDGAFARALLRGLRRPDVLHIARPLILAADPDRRRPLPPRAPAQPAARPSVSVVIPTRDRAKMLRRCVASLLAQNPSPPFELVLVDNGGTQADALRALDEFARRPNVTRIDAPGPFNFAKLCNLGAAAARGEALVFLNNDVEILGDGFLEALAAPAMRPDIGAVGALLLYPDGRIQHAGLVVGMGESVGHAEAGLPGAAPGWLGRNGATHEVSAVTGAALAVERAKFIRAGGFDEVNLPIEFNDVDLCLRLDEMGFRTLFTPCARALHFESASRGKATFRRRDVHGAERAYFCRRWMDRLRDDPYYHPGLSSFSTAPMLA